MRSRMLLTALAVLGCLVVAARADTTIYQDSFHRNIDNHNGTFSPAPLAGSAPDVVNTGAAVWASHSQWNTVINTGGIGYADLNSLPKGDYSGFLPFVPQQGNVYTLSADFLMYADTRYEAGALGFAYAVSGYPSSIANNGTAWAVERVNSDYSVSLGRGYAHYGAGVYDDFRLYQNISPPNPQSDWNDFALHTFSVVLDTRSQYWTMSASADGVTYASYDYTNAIAPKNPGINYVGFSGTNALSVENFTLTQRQFLAGDANGDGTVNGADLNVVLSNYNLTGMGWAQGDFGADGTVNGADLNIVLSNYNQSGGVASAVPEPNALWLALAAAAGLLAHAQRKRNPT
jgi:hypothetical protein